MSLKQGGSSYESPDRTELKAIINRYVSDEFLDHPVTHIAGTVLFGAYFGATLGAVQGYIQIPPVPLQSKKTVDALHRMLVKQYAISFAAVLGFGRVFWEIRDIVRPVENDWVGNGVIAFMTTLCLKYVAPGKPMKQFIAPAVITGVLFSFMTYVGMEQVNRHTYWEDADEVRDKYVQLMQERKVAHDAELYAIEKASFLELDD